MLWGICVILVLTLTISSTFIASRRKAKSQKEASAIVITDLGKPNLPLPIRVFNLLGKLSRRRQLTTETIIQEAQSRTRLKSFLDEDTYPFKDGLEKLVQDYNNQKNRLTTFGKLCLRKVFVRMVSNNLIIAEQIQRHPSILSEPILSPVFIIGPPRTGSSHLHDTLSNHPVFRTPKHMELLSPVLKEEFFNSTASDPREQGCNAYLKFAHYVRPYLTLLHDARVHASEEDIFVTGIVFRSIIYGSMFPCKEYMQWFGETDHKPAYTLLKLVLQLLQWQDVQMGRPRKRWLLKSPDHSFSLPSLIKVFPDATIIQTHREMTAVLPSYLNLVVYIHGIFVDLVDLQWTGEWWTAWFEFVLHRFVKDQQNVNGQVIDVLFTDLVSDDLSVVLRILSLLGVNVDPDTHQHLAKHVLTHKRHSKGRVIYNGSVFGLKKHSIRDLFTTYHKAFGLIKDTNQRSDGLDC